MQYIGKAKKIKKWIKSQFFLKYTTRSVNKDDNVMMHLLPVTIYNNKKCMSVVFCFQMKSQMAPKVIARQFKFRAGLDNSLWLTMKRDMPIIHLLARTAP